MASYNQATIVGNLGGDPETGVTQAGRHWAHFSVATNERWTDKAGQKQERTEWHRVVAWEKLADLVDAYIGKGAPVMVVGKLQTRRYDKDDGSVGYVTEIVARDILFLGAAKKDRPPPPQDDDVPPARSWGGELPAERATAPPPGASTHGDDIPF